MVILKFSKGFRAMSYVIKRNDEKYFQAAHRCKDGQVSYGPKAKATEFSLEEAQEYLGFEEAHFLNEKLGLKYEIVNTD
jgi:hypothetical protein